MFLPKKGKLKKNELPSQNLFFCKKEKKIIKNKNK